MTATPVGLQIIRIADSFHLFECDDDVRRALADHGRIDLFAPVHLRGDAAAALAHTVDLRHFDVVARLHQAVDQDLGRQDGALTADADKECALCCFHGSVLLSGNGALRADLRADRAADALVRIDVGLLVADGDGRAGYLQAALAADTFLLVHHALADVVLDALDEQARASRDDGSGDLGGKRVCTACSMASRSCGSTM